MNTFDRHVIAHTLAATGLLMALIIVFFVVLDYLEHIDDFMDRGVPWEAVVFDYYLKYIPEIIRLTSPLAVFLGVIFVTSRLAQTMQIVALRSAGVSLARLLRPFALVGGALALLMFVFNGWLVPQTQADVLEFQQRYLRTAQQGVLSGHVYRQTAPGSIIRVGYYDRRDDRAFRVSLQEFEETASGARARRLVRRLDAAEMAWVDSLGIWRLREVVIRDFEAGRPAVRQPSLDTLLAVRPADLARTERDVERLTLTEAAAHIGYLRRAGADNLGRPLVAYHSRFSYPLANLIVVLIGVPLAAVRRRGGQAVPFAIGLLVAFGYLALQRLSEPFGFTGAVPPIVVAWLPHLVFLGLAIILLVYSRK